MSIDDFVARFAPPFPGHVKIDVDGLEWAILKGAERTLRDPRLSSILVELPADDASEREQIEAYLRESGFELVERGPVQSAPGGAGANHIFRRAVAADGS
jgi:hypothetical protein